MRIAACQLEVCEDKAANIARACAAVASAAAGGAQLVVLPEMFCCPYSTRLFGAYSEGVPGGPACAALSGAARASGVWVVGGSVPESSGGRLYNTCPVFGPDGALVARHRKAHLFDIDVPGKITFKESETLSAGEALTTFDTPWCRVGVGICYDVRFPEYWAVLSRSLGCSLLCLPGAFNMTTGPAHWELLIRSRALDCQSYFVAVSPARSTKPDAPYVAWGHSTVADPWGRVVATTEHEPAIIFADYDAQQVESTRKSIPTSQQRRPDVYTLPSRVSSP
eukprot:m51a1_g1762 putative omega-amidase nit2 (280) ;mRNA; r:288483-289712